MNFKNLHFFDSDGYELNFEFNEKMGYWEGSIFLPKVSVGLYANTSLYILEEGNGTENTFEIKDIDETTQEEISSGNLSFSDSYFFPWDENEGLLSFSWDKLNTFVDEFFMFDFDEEYVLTETSALIYTPNDGPDCETLIVNTFDNYDVPLDNTFLSKALPIHVAFMANEKYDATTYNRTLVLTYYSDRNNRRRRNSQVIARIRFFAETVEEDERLKIWNDNLGYNITPEDTMIFYKSDIKEYRPDYILLNEKRKELMLEGSNIYPYIGSYKAIINAIKFFGYDNLNIIEYWRCVNPNDENFGKIYHSSRYSLTKKETLRIGARNILLPNKDYKKINALALVYDINKLTGEVDEWELPLVKEQFTYTIEEALIKLFALRKKLNKEFMPGNSRIIDIIGEANYFGIHGLFKMHDAQLIEETFRELKLNFDIYPSKYVHITDNEYFNRYINIKEPKSTTSENSLPHNIPLQYQIVSDLSDMSLNDFQGNDMYLHPSEYKIGLLSNYELCDYYKDYYREVFEDFTVYKAIMDNDAYPYESPEYDYYENPFQRFSAKVVLDCSDFEEVTFGNCELNFGCTQYNSIYNPDQPNLHAIDFENPEPIENPNRAIYRNYCKYKGSISGMNSVSNPEKYDLYYVDTPGEEDVYIYDNGWKQYKDISFLTIDGYHNVNEITWTVRMSKGEVKKDGKEYQIDDELKAVGIEKYYERKELDNDYISPEDFTKTGDKVFFELPFVGYYDVTMTVHNHNGDQMKTKTKCIKVEPYQLDVIGFYYDTRSLPKDMRLDPERDGQMLQFIHENIVKMSGWARSERTSIETPTDYSMPIYTAFGEMTNTGPYYNENVENEWYLSDNISFEMSELKPLIKYSRYIRNGVDVKPYTWFLLGYEYSKIAGKVNPRWTIRNNETGIVNEYPEFQGKYLTLLLKKVGTYTVTLNIQDQLGNDYSITRNIIVVDKAANYKLYQSLRKDYDYMIEQDMLKDLKEYNTYQWEDAE